MVKVAVLGASGGIGQPLSLLLKLNPLVSELSLYDIVNVKGVAADLSHINTQAKVIGYQGQEELEAALKDCEVVVIPAGIPRKPGMTRDDLFKINAGIVKDLGIKISKICPKAFILVISNPVNSTVPIIAEVLKKENKFDPKRLFGVTTLDSVRASTFVTQGSNLDPKNSKIPVVGGHSGVTIVPLLSKAQPRIELSAQDVDSLTNRIQFGGDEVVKAKDGGGSATLSMAHAGARFANSVMEAYKTGKSVIEAAYISIDADKEGAEKLKEYFKDCTYFAFDVKLSVNGVEKIIPFEQPNEYEKQLLNKAASELSQNIKKGIDFVHKL